MDPEEIKKQKNNSDSDKEEETEAMKKLSKGQKKKLKEQQKKLKQMEEAQKKQEGGKVEGAEGETQEKKEQQKEEKKDKKKKGGKMNAAALLAKKKLQQQQAFEREQEKKKKEWEAEQERIRLEEEKAKRKQQEAKDAATKAAKQITDKEKKDGLYMSKKQKQKVEKARAQLELANKLADEQKNGQKKQKPVQKKKTQKQLKEEEEKKERIRKKEEKYMKDSKFDFELKEGEYRSPVCCILGHVDTGKTTLLDKIRKTNVQEGEAGGITQQIGATFFPKAKLIEEVSKCKNILDIEVNVPGLLIIDTPGHESFSNLRSRGSSLCDIAILVIDIQHGLQKQTLESLELLRKGKTPFVVALNKIDRSYAWEAFNDSCSYESLKKQTNASFNDYKTKLDQVILQLNEKGYNACLYWENQDRDDYISLVPTSGITGEGIPDILANIVSYCLTIKSITKRIKIRKDRFKCTVMEVKMTEGYGTTIDCLLVDGAIKKEDQIVLLGFDGPIVTKVKALLTPHPMKEMRVKDQYLHHNVVFAANGVKIAAIGLDQAVAGSPLIVCHNEEEVKQAIIECKDQLDNIQKNFKLQNLGVGVAASTLGSLEALMEYLRTQKIPVSHISVGPVSRQDVIHAMKSMLSQVPEKRKEEYACLLVFDIKVLADAQKYAEQNGIKIFTANIIYHLTDHFNKHVEEVRAKRREAEGKDAVFPCILKQVAAFRKNGPIVLGVDIEYGVLKIGTPICIYRQKEKTGDKQVKLGVVQSIEHNHKKLKQARKQTGSVAIVLGGDPSIALGKHFEAKDKLVSMVSRRSIDCLKQHFREEVKKDEWALVIQLKKYFNVI